MKTLPKISESVQQYLDTKEYNNTGEFFRIGIIREDKFPSLGSGMAHSGIAYLCGIIIQEKIDGYWVSKYGSGLIEWRSAYNSKYDNWDLSIYDVTILKENKDKKLKDMVTYGLRTGAGNIKIYQFSSSNYIPILIASFNKNEYQKVMEGNEHA